MKDIEQEVEEIVENYEEEKEYVKEIKEKRSGDGVQEVKGMQFRRWRRCVQRTIQVTISSSFHSVEVNLKIVFVSALV